MNNRYSFAEAMNIVGNGGLVGRETLPEAWYIGLNKEDDIVSLYEINDDNELDYIEVYAPDLEDIKAQDWYLRETPKKKDTRNEQQISFDEELLSIVDSLEEMNELAKTGQLDHVRLQFLYDFGKAITQYKAQKVKKQDSLSKEECMKEIVNLLNKTQGVGGIFTKGIYL